MNRVSTNQLPKSISSIFPNRFAGIFTEVLFLLFVGMLAIVIHSRLRIPLQLPGRQGVLFLAMIVMGRGLSRFPFAATLECAGAALMLATGWLGFREPLTPITYLLAGIILDLLYAQFRRFIPFILATSLSCALGWMFVPLIKAGIATLTGLLFTSLRYGLVWPILTHLVFGFAGGVLGASILSLPARFLNKH